MTGLTEVSWILMFAFAFSGCDNVLHVASGKHDYVLKEWKERRQIKSWYYKWSSDLKDTLKGSQYSPHSRPHTENHCFRVFLNWNWLPRWHCCAAAKPLQSCLTLHHPMDCSLPGSSIHRVFQQEYWSGVPLPSPPRWHIGRESAGQCRRHRRHKFDPWVGKIPWRRKWQPTPVSLPGKSHGQRSLRAAVHGVTKRRTWLRD